MQIPGLGAVTKDESLGWYYSAPIRLDLFNGEECQVVVEGYEDDEASEEFDEAIANLLSSPFSVLQAAEQYVFQYYLDMNSNWELTDEEFIRIDTPADVWRHVQFGAEPMVTRRSYGDHGVYVSIACNCDWEPEHGLQIVLKNGAVVCKVGPYNGHLTNSDAYADESLEHVVYR